MTLPEAYAYLVVYEVGNGAAGDGTASTYWADEAERVADGWLFHSYSESLYVSDATPMFIKVRTRDQVPNGVVAEFEGCHPSEVSDD